MSKHYFPILEKANLVWRDNLPYSAVFDDIYFSLEDGMAETKHVFIQGNQLEQRWQNLTGQSFFIIAELGFGTGLNFLVTLDSWLKTAPIDKTLYYYSCEKHPLILADLKRCLDLWPSLNSLSQELLTVYPVLTPGMHHLFLCGGRVQLVLMLGDALDCYKQLLICGDPILEANLRHFAVDAWYLDGFSPAKNALMWQEPLIHTIALLSKSNTSLASFSVAKSIREALQQKGFSIEKKRGYGKKREMLVATYQGMAPLYKQRRWTPWYHNPHSSSYQEKKAVIIGAGLAGCFTAYHLAKKGWSVIVLEAQKACAQGASANPQTVLYPKFSAFSSPLAELMLTAFLYAYRFYSPKIGKDFIGELKGMLQFTKKEDEAAQEQLQTWLSHYPDLASIVEAEEASKIVGLNLTEGGLYIPNSGWIDAPSLCHYLLQHPLIELKCEQEIHLIGYENGQWLAGKESAAVLIIANSFRANQFLQTQHLPLKSVGGQLTFMEPTAASQEIRIPLCRDGHLLPFKNGLQSFGATYHIRSPYKGTNAKDDEVNIARLEQFPFGYSLSATKAGNWGAIRATTTDYLPLVGAVTKSESFYHTYAGLAKNTNYFIAEQPDYYPNLYVCCGFGSRGLTTIPLLSHWLASLINLEPTTVSNNIIKAISPARFLYKDLIRGKK